MEINTLWAAMDQYEQLLGQIEAESFQEAFWTPPNPQNLFKNSKVSDKWKNQQLQQIVSYLTPDQPLWAAAILQGMGLSTRFSTTIPMNVLGPTRHLDQAEDLCLR